MCMIKIFMGGGWMVDGEGGNSERYLKWGDGGGVIKESTENILK